MEMQPCITKLDDDNGPPPAVGLLELASKLVLDCAKQVTDSAAEMAATPSAMTETFQTGRNI